MSVKGFAPGWVACCSKCPYEVDLESLGWVRVGAYSWGKRHAIPCPDCGRHPLDANCSCRRKRRTGSAIRVGAEESSDTSVTDSARFVVDICVRPGGSQGLRIAVRNRCFAMSRDHIAEGIRHNYHPVVTRHGCRVSNVFALPCALAASVRVTFLSFNSHCDQDETPAAASWTRPRQPPP